MRTSVVLVLLLAACSGDSPDGPTTCTGALYDKCVDEHDCLGGNCRPFGTFQVCTQACDTTTPCPADDTGNAAACTNNLCVPAEQNDCALQSQ
ncbi:MAG: hypothetical protein QM831_05170 [Kofleriaceae bacterium]